MSPGNPGVPAIYLPLCRGYEIDVISCQTFSKNLFYQLKPIVCPMRTPGVPLVIKPGYTGVDGIAFLLCSCTNTTSCQEKKNIDLTV